LNSAIALGALYPGTRFTLTRVVEPTVAIVTPLAPYPTPLEPERIARLEVEARNYLERIRGQLQALGLEATYQVLVGWGIATQVLQLAEALGADCIVVGTHSRRGMERLVLGSEADRIVRRATVPVLIAANADAGRRPLSESGDPSRATRTPPKSTETDGEAP
jgi:nucleotide-binding universal stress UspA family protein